MDYKLPDLKAITGPAINIVHAVAQITEIWQKLVKIYLAERCEQIKEWQFETTQIFGMFEVVLVEIG